MQWVIHSIICNIMFSIAMTTAFMFKDMRTGFWWWWWKRQQKKLMFFIRSGYGEGHEKAANTSWSESEGENIWKKTSKSIFTMFRNFLITDVFLEQSRWQRCIKQMRITFFLTTHYRLVLLSTYQDQNLRLHMCGQWYSQKGKNECS